MDADEPLETELNDDGIDVVELLERAEHSLLDKHDDKYWATEEEILSLAEATEQEPKVYQDVGRNWIIEIVYERIKFIHVTSCALSFGRCVKETIN